MKRIKEIISALKTLGMNPAEELRSAVTEISKIIADSESEAEHAGDFEESAGRMRANMFKQILSAVADIAEDMEKPAKAEGEAAK